MSIYATEMVALDSLRPHPQNYRQHPEDQLAQIKQSITDHGIYKNIVVARDGTILAGHGAVVACRQLGMTEIPVKRIDCDPFSPQAMKIIVGDNEIGKLCETDDRALTEILKALSSADDLLGTGFNDQSLTALVMVSRPIEEIRDKNEAAEWIGMPEFDAGSPLYRMSMLFRSSEDRERFVDDHKIVVIRRYKDSAIWSAWWPEVEPVRDTKDQATFLDE